jgi:hypothetical protein
MPGVAAKSLLSPDDPPQKVGAFPEHQFWVCRRTVCFVTVIVNFFIFSLCLLNVFLIDAAQFPGYTRFYLFAKGHLEQATPRMPAGGHTRAP